MDLGNGAGTGGWAEVLYLLIARYDMPDPRDVAKQFKRHSRDHGEEVPAVSCIRRNVDADESDLGGFAGGRKSDAEIREYLREILRFYDAGES